MASRRQKAPNFEDFIFIEIIITHNTHDSLLLNYENCHSSNEYVQKRNLRTLKCQQRLFGIKVNDEQQKANLQHYHDKTYLASRYNVGQDYGLVFQNCTVLTNASATTHAHYCLLITIRVRLICYKTQKPRDSRVVEVYLIIECLRNEEIGILKISVLYKLHCCVLREHVISVCTNNFNILHGAEVEEV